MEIAPTSSVPQPGHPRVLDLAAIKSKQQATWSSGDYGNIGVRLQIVGESLSEAADIQAGESVLDVAAGNGNASLAAARRFAQVTSTDYVPWLLEQGRRRADGDRLPVTFQVADAESLPFPEGSFDAVLSTFGVMFSPDHERAAAEMLRVVKPGGRIGLANWTPDGFIGEFFRVVTSFVPPPDGLRSPLAWGTETYLATLFGAQAADIRTRKSVYTFRFQSPEHWFDYFRTFYGPTFKAYAALEERRRDEFRVAMMELARRWNRSTRGTLVAPGEYLEVVITRKS